MEENRVVITGLGAVTPIGLGVREFWTALTEGRNGIARVTHFDPGEFRSHMAAEVKSFNPTDWIDIKTAQRMDRFVHFAMAASAMALSDAGLDQHEFDGDNAGVIIGSGIGGADTIQEGYTLLHSRGPKSIGPFFVSKSLINTAACMVSISHGLRGPLSAPSVACSTGSNAIGDAFRIIQRGDAEIMLAGGSEASISPLPFGGFCATHSMSTRNDQVEGASRPFDKNRDGFVMGEGSGIVILENLDHALNRNARIYAEMAGYGSTADAFHFTAPEPSGRGMIKVMEKALKDAGLEPQDVGHINAHGTSTVLNDKIESSSIKKVFGDEASRIKVSSIKSMIGHLLAAAGAVEFVAAAKSIQTGIIPPTINCESPDPECPLNIVTKGAESFDGNAVISNSFGFGGGNVCLAVKVFKE